MRFSESGVAVSFGDAVGTGSVTAGVSVTFGSCDAGVADVFAVGFGELLAVSPFIGYVFRSGSSSSVIQYSLW